jgi:DNA-binding LacI/PurR family transcriptional regulator
MNPPIQVPPTTVEQLAQRLEIDLKASGLAVGDAYLTAAEVGVRFGVSEAMANRAMKLMADRGLLTRHRSRGTFVGLAAGAGGVERATMPGVVHVLVAQERAAEFDYGVAMQALRRVLPGSAVQFAEVPAQGSLERVRQMVERDAGTAMGVLVVGCGLGVQRYLAQAPVRAVVLEGGFGDVGALANVSVDMRGAGMLLARHLISQGHTRLALVTGQYWLPGDNAFHEGVLDALAEAKLSDRALRIRSLPADVRSVESEGRLLTAMEGGPTGFICMGRFYAQVLYQAISDFCPAQVAAYVTSEPALTGTEIACCAIKGGEGAVFEAGGRMLMEMSQRRPLASTHVVLRVGMIENANLKTQTLRGHQ